MGDSLPAVLLVAVLLLAISAARVDSLPNRLAAVAAIPIGGDCSRRSARTDFRHHLLAGAGTTFHLERGAREKPSGQLALSNP